MSFKSFSQDGLALQVGSGVGYAGLYGSKISLCLGWVGFSGEIGQYHGPPLSFGSIDNWGRLTSKNQTGLGFGIGIDFWYTDYTYTSLQYIRAGTYKPENMAKITLEGINWSVFAGRIYFGNSSIFLDWGINLAFVFPENEEKESEVGGMIGISLGLGYSFDFW